MSLCPSCGADTGDVAKFCPSCGASILRTAPGADPMVGRIVAGKFRVEALLGEGGMGMVYKATQVNLEKLIVLKVLRPSLMSDERTVARFQREAKAASRLNHPNSIQVIDFGQAADDGSMYIAMEYCPGHDLHHILSTEWPLEEPRIIRIIGQVLSALAEAHAHGVIHRDLKPENIMVEQRRGEPDFVKVLDFGIAKIQDSTGEEGQALTRQGFVCGTPEYMSPEQAKGASVDHRSDLYAVGVILYQMVTGLLPFDSESAVGFATAHLTQEPPALRKRRPDARVSPGLDRLIMKALSKDAANRPQSAEVFRAELLDLAPGSGAYTIPTAPFERPPGFPATAPGAPESTQVSHPQGWSDRTPAEGGQAAWGDKTPADTSAVVNQVRSAGKMAASRPAPKPAPTPPDAPAVPPPAPSRAPLIAVGVGGILLLAAGGFYVLSTRKPPPDDLQPAGSTGASAQLPDPVVKPVKPVKAPEPTAGGPEVSLTGLSASDPDRPTPDEAPNREGADKDLQKAKRVLSGGDKAGARKLLYKAYRQDPRNSSVLLYLGICWRPEDEHRALYWFREGQKVAPENEAFPKAIKDVEASLKSHEPDGRSASSP